MSSNAPSDYNELSVNDVAIITQQIVDEVERAIVGKTDVLRMILAACLSSGGHVLLEDYPGLAKTLIANSFAEVLGLSFKRIQFTPDLLPGDITGGYVYDRLGGNFELRRGPLFANIILADEINRASPEDAIRAPGGNAGVPGDAGGRDTATARPLYRDRYTEPHRVRRYVSTARGTARSLYDEALDRLSVSRRGTGDSSPPARTSSGRVPAQRGDRCGRACWRCDGLPSGFTWIQTSSATWSSWREPRGGTATWRLGRAREAGSRC